MKSYYNFVITGGSSVHSFQWHSFHWILSQKELLAWAFYRGVVERVQLSCNIYYLE